MVNPAVGFPPAPSMPRRRRAGRSDLSRRRPDQVDAAARPARRRPLCRRLAAERLCSRRCAGPRIAGNKTARLLIGDKVVCDEPAGLPHQLDLGGAWKDLTGLPFVFAAWMARAETQLRDLLSSLRDAKTSGLQN